MVTALLVGEVLGSAGSTGAVTRDTGLVEVVVETTALPVLLSPELLSVLLEAPLLAPPLLLGDV